GRARSRHATSAPSRASRIAVARPIPRRRAAPVTSATFPSMPENAMPRNLYGHAMWALNEPRVGADLSPIDDTALEDDVTWTDVLATGVSAVPRALAHVEILGSRLRGLRLTGCEVRKLRL